MSDRSPHAFPQFSSVEEERRHRKQRLAAAFRLFGKFGFDEGSDDHVLPWTEWAWAADTTSGRAAWTREWITNAAAGIGGELHLAASLHRDEPPGRLVDALADREQAVVPQDRRLAVAERVGDALALVQFDTTPVKSSNTAWSP